MAAAGLSAVLLTLASCSSEPVSIAVEDGYTFRSAFIDDLPADAAGGAYAASAEEEAAIGQMELQIENEFLALYYNPLYADVAVKDKRTGRIWFSNRAVYFEDGTSRGSDEAQSEAFSQIRLWYFDQQTRQDTMSSYPDALDGMGSSNVTAEVAGDTLRVTYTIGQKRDDMLVFSAMLPETYERYLEQAQALRDEDVLAPNEFATFRDSYAYYDLNEALSEEEREEWLTDFPLLEKQPQLYLLMEGLSDVEMERMETVAEALGVTRGDIDAETEKIGGAQETAASAYFVIPVEYQLDGADLIARIEGERIECAADYRLSRVEFLPQFAAAPKGTPGFMLVPDGSGAIIQNDTPGKDMYTFSMPFYGPDYGLDLAGSDDLASVSTLPVYGLRSGNAAVVAVMENGEAACGLTAEVANDTAEYNRLKLWYTYQPYDEVKYSWEESGSGRIVFAAEPAATQVAVRYHFLYGEDVDAAAMAAYTREYLLKTGELSEPEGSMDMSLSLELLGSVDKYKQFFGFSKRSVEALTTFEEAEQLLKTLHEAGVDNADITYTAWVNGGSRYTIPSRLKILNELGGETGLRELIASAGELGYRLYPDVDFVSSYVNKLGTGYTSGRDAVQFISKNAAVAGDYDLVDGRRSVDNPRYLINPSSYGWISDRFLKAWKPLSNPYISLLYAGEQLGANYAEKNFIQREDAKELTAGLLRKLQEEGQALLVSGGNRYVLPYADYIRGVPTTASEVRIEASSVPFVSMVLRGMKRMSGQVINTSSDYQEELLRTVENGLDLSFSLMAAENAVLKDALGGQTATVSQEIWLQKVIGAYTRYHEEFASLAGQTISGYRSVTDALRCVTYEDGTRVYVNYGEEAAPADGITVPARDYMVVKTTEGR